MKILFEGFFSVNRLSFFITWKKNETSLDGMFHSALFVTNMQKLVALLLNAWYVFIHKNLKLIL